jgi:WD40 repeat protein/transcriptional regulator with XRE-family HTH domain
MEEIPQRSEEMKKMPLTAPLDKLKYERELRGWSQALVAEKIGAPQASLINRWEKGHAFPSPHYRQKLCALFEKDAEALGLIKKGTGKANQNTESPAESSQTPVELPAAISVLPVVQPAVQQQSLLTRRSALFGLLGGGLVAVAGIGSLSWWGLHQSSSPRHPSPSSPTVTTLYIYKTDPPALVNFISWSHRGSFIVCSLGDQTVRVLEATTGHTSFIYRGHTNFVECAKSSPDETRIASASKDKTVQIWKPLTGELLLTYRGHTDTVYCVTWSHDGTRVASCGADKTVQVWDAFTGKLLTKYLGHTAEVWNITWSPDDTSIATCGTDDSGIQIWNSATGVKNAMFTYQGPKGTVTEIDWSPVGNRLVSTHIDSSVHIWDTVSGYNVLTYTGHTATAETARWSPNGKYIASGADDKTMQIWSPTTGECFYTYRKHTDKVFEVSWSSDNQGIASCSVASDDETVHVCKFKP